MANKDLRQIVINPYATRTYENGISGHFYPEVNGIASLPATWYNADPTVRGDEMTREELLAIKICKIARESKDVVDILVAADALEEAGDIRGNAIRNHSKCCNRGYNIIECISNRYNIIKDMNEFFNEQTEHPDMWGCI